MAKAKGWTIVGAVRFLRTRKPEARLALPPALHHYLEDRILESSWYPEEDLVTLLEAVVSLLPGPRERVLEEMGALTAREHLEGIYAHLALAGRESMWRRAMALWSSQHDTGRWDVTEAGPAELRMTVTGFARPSEILCGITRGYLCEALRLAGHAEVVATKQTCMAAGDAACTWQVRFRAGD